MGSTLYCSIQLLISLLPKSTTPIPPTYRGPPAPPPPCAPACGHACSRIRPLGPPPSHGQAAGPRGTGAPHSCSTPPHRARTRAGRPRWRRRLPHPSVGKRPHLEATAGGGQAIISGGGRQWLPYPSAGRRLAGEGRGLAIGQGRGGQGAGHRSGQGRAGSWL